MSNFSVCPRNWGRSKLPPFVAIVISGAICGIFLFPYLLVDDVKDLEKDMIQMKNEMTNLKNVLGFDVKTAEAHGLINKEDGIIDPNMNPEKAHDENVEEEIDNTIPAEKEEFDRKPWSDKIRVDIISALNSSDLTEVEWAEQELEYYSQHGISEATELLFAYKRK